MQAKDKQINGVKSIALAAVHIPCMEITCMASSIVNHLQHCSTLCTAPIWPFFILLMLKVELGMRSSTACRIKWLPQWFHWEYCSWKEIHIWTAIQEKDRRVALRVAELNKGHLFWWLKKRWLGAEIGDPGLEKSVQLGFQPVVGAYWGNLLGRTAGNMIVGVCLKYKLKMVTGVAEFSIFLVFLFKFSYIIFLNWCKLANLINITQKSISWEANVSAFQKSRVNYLGKLGKMSVNVFAECKPCPGMVCHICFPSLTSERPLLHS